MSFTVIRAFRVLLEGRFRSILGARSPEHAQGSGSICSQSNATEPRRLERIQWIGLSATWKRQFFWNAKPSAHRGVRKWHWMTLGRLKPISIIWQVRSFKFTKRSANIGVGSTGISRLRWVEKYTRWSLH